jgi:hypothetical protein
VVSQEDVEVVWRFTEPANGQDLVPAFEQMAELLGPEVEPSVILAYWAEHPVWKHAAPDIEWFSDAVLLANTASGPREVVMWWKEWVEMWESYVITTVEVRDLGDWVLHVADVRARGRQGIAVEMRVFELARVRDERITAYGAGFGSERAALEAVGIKD